MSRNSCGYHNHNREQTRSMYRKSCVPARHTAFYLKNRLYRAEPESRCCRMLHFGIGIIAHQRDARIFAELLLG